MINLDYLIKASNNSVGKQDFFIDFFTTLAGTKQLQQQIEAGLSEKDIRASWAEGLSKFKATRSNYLIYD